MIDWLDVMSSTPTKPMEHGVKKMLEKKTVYVLFPQNVQNEEPFDLSTLTVRWYSLLQCLYIVMCDATMP